MDFAPYQSSPPENNRPFSPLSAGATSPRASLDYARRAFSPTAHAQSQSQSQSSPPPLQHPQPQRSWQQRSSVAGYGYGYGYGYTDGDAEAGYGQGQAQAQGNSNGHAQGYGVGYGGDGGSGSGGGRGVGGGGGGGDGRGGLSEFDTSLGVRLDYEAALAYLGLPPLGAIILLILERQSDYVRFHAWQSSLLFTAVFIVHLVFSWSTFLSWVFLIADLFLMAWLARRAYIDSHTLDWYEVPIFGQIASRILDDE